MVALLTVIPLLDVASSQTVVMSIRTPSPFTPFVVWVETLPSLDTTVVVV